LNLPIPQDIVITGRLISADGYVGPVSGLPEKIQAASVTSNIRRMLFPDFNKDKSVDTLTPKESDRITRAIVDSKKSLRIDKVDDLADVVKLIFTEDLICESSLREGYFGNHDNNGIGSTPLDNVIAYLRDGNSQRFWNTLERYLFECNFDAARNLTAAYSHFHFKEKVYPLDFGEDLLKLAISLPPTIKNKPGYLPLVRVPDYIQLVQYVKETDFDDVPKLHQAAFEKRSYRRSIDSLQDDIDSKSSADNILQYFLKELSPERIAEQVLIPLDNARASYSINSVIVESFDEFLDYISSFHAHMLRHCGKLGGNIDSGELTGDALDHVSQAFYKMGQDKGAYIEAKSGVRGGLRYVFDAMTSLLKSKAQRIYVGLVLKSAIDPLDDKAKTKVIQSIINQLGPNLPEGLIGKSPCSLINDFPEVIKAYSESTDHLIEKLKLM
jgi:hypothetical protein